MIVGFVLVRVYIGGEGAILLLKRWRLKNVNKLVEREALIVSVRVKSAELELNDRGSRFLRKNLEQKIILQLGHLNPHVITERFSFN